MRRLLTAALGALALSGQALAFDFTPKSFEAIYDRAFRLSGLRVNDRCYEPEKIGYNCEYGIYGKDPSAFVSNAWASRDEANAVGLSWSVGAAFLAHSGQLKSFVDVCSPELSEAKRDEVVSTLMAQAKIAAQAPVEKRVMANGVRYVFTMQEDGSAGVRAWDLRMRGDDLLMDLPGDEVEIK